MGRWPWNEVGSAPPDIAVDVIHQIEYGQPPLEAATTVVLAALGVPQAAMASVGEEQPKESEEGLLQALKKCG